MATLFERLIGLDLENEIDLPENEKLAIHAYTGALNEFRRGRLNGPQLVAFFDLNTNQQTDTIYWKDLWQAAPNNAEFMRVFKDWLYLGETETDSIYLVEANFVQRLEVEVTSQGGTLP